MNNPVNIEQNKEDIRRHDDDEIALRELFSVIWQGKWIIIFITALFAITSVVYLINKPNIYQSEVLLAPAEEDSQSGLAGLAGQFGGLASLAGVNLGGGSSNKSQLAFEVLKSRKFVSDFVEKHNILPALMAVKSWNMETNKVVYDVEIYDVQKNIWLREVKAPFKPKPSMQEAYKQFKEIVSVNVDKETGMVTLAVEHVSPYVAQQWVSWLVEDINATMKQRDVIEANKSAVFLTRQIEQTEVSDIRTVLYKLIEEQTKTIMFANVRDEYVFKIIDPPLIPEEKLKPSRALICFFVTLIGGILSVMLVLVIHFSKK